MQSKRDKAIQIAMLKKETMQLGERRVRSMMIDTGESTKDIWQKEKQAHIKLAKLEGKTLREGFAES